MRSLSGGMKRRVLVAQALVHKPPVIVLDEPTAGVDVELRQSLWQFIARLNRDGHTMLLTTHYLEEAEALCSRIAMLKAGRVVALDTTQNLLSRFAGRHRARFSRGALPGAMAGARCCARDGQRALSRRSTTTPRSSSCSPRCARPASRSTSSRSPSRPRGRVPADHGGHETTDERGRRHVPEA